MCGLTSEKFLVALTAPLERLIHKIAEEPFLHRVFSRSDIDEPPLRALIREELTRTLDAQAVRHAKRRTSRLC